MIKNIKDIKNKDYYLYNNLFTWGGQPDINYNMMFQHQFGQNSLASPIDSQNIDSNLYLNQIPQSNNIDTSSLQSQEPQGAEETGGQGGAGSSIAGTVGKIAHSLGTGLTAVSKAKPFNKMKTASQIINGYDAGGWMQLGADSIKHITNAVSEINETNDLGKSVLNGVSSGQNLTGNSFDDLAQSWNSYRPQSHVSYKDFYRGTTSGVINSIGQGLEGSGSGLQAGGAVGAIVGGVMGTGMGIFSNLTARHQAKKWANKINQKIDAANQFAANSFTNSLSNTASNQLSSMEQNYAAYGGNINKDMNKNNYLNSLLGRNSFDFGGEIMTNGGTYGTGMVHIDTGSTHEENPYSGVQIGEDSNGTPNMVEENETIYNDYVFSARLKVPKQKKKKTKEYTQEEKVLKKYEGLTYSDAAKKAEKDSGLSERPTDTIAKRGFESELEILKRSQEKERAAKQLQEQKDQIDAMSPEEFEQMQQQQEMQEGAMQNQNQMPQEQSSQEELAQMQQMSPEDQQAMQQQTIEDQAMQQQQTQPQEQPSPEQTAQMQQMQQQIPQEVTQGQPMTAYGGQLYAEGGNLTEDQAIKEAREDSEGAVEDSQKDIQQLNSDNPTMDQPQMEEAPQSEIDTLSESNVEDMSTSDLNRAIDQIYQEARNLGDTQLAKRARKAKRMNREEKEDFVDDALEELKEIKEQKQQEDQENQNPENQEQQTNPEEELQQPQMDQPQIEDPNAQIAENNAQIPQEGMPNPLESQNNPMDQGIPQQFADGGNLDSSQLDSFMQSLSQQQDENAQAIYAQYQQLMQQGKQDQAMQLAYKVYASLQQQDSQYACGGNLNKFAEGGNLNKYMETGNWSDYTSSEELTTELVNQLKKDGLVTATQAMHLRNGIKNNKVSLEDLKQQVLINRKNLIADRNKYYKKTVAKQLGYKNWDDLMARGSRYVINGAQSIVNKAVDKHAVKGSKKDVEITRNTNTKNYLKKIGTNGFEAYVNANNGRKVNVTDGMYERGFLLNRDGTLKLDSDNNPIPIGNLETAPIVNWDQKQGKYTDEYNKILDNQNPYNSDYDWDSYVAYDKNGEKIIADYNSEDLRKRYGNQENTFYGKLWNDKLKDLSVADYEQRAEVIAYRNALIDAVKKAGFDPKENPYSKRKYDNTEEMPAVIRRLYKLGEESKDNTKTNRYFDENGYLKDNWQNLFTRAMTDGTLAQNHFIADKYGRRYALVNNEGHFIDDQGNLTDTPLYVQNPKGVEGYSLYGYLGNDKDAHNGNDYVKTFGVLAGDISNKLMKGPDGSVYVMPKNYQGVLDKSPNPMQGTPLPIGYTGKDTWYTLNDENPTEGIPYPKPSNFPWLMGLGLQTAAAGYNILKPADYTNADAMIAAAQKAGKFMPISPEMLGDYEVFKAIDSDISKIAGDQRLTGLYRQNANLSAQNRGTALAANNSAFMNNALVTGKNIMNDWLANRQEEHNVDAFNNKTNTFNATARMDIAKANQDSYAKSRAMYLDAIGKGYSLREQIANDKAKAISGSITGLANAMYNKWYNDYTNAQTDFTLKTNQRGPVGWTFDNNNNPVKVTKNGKTYKIIEDKTLQDNLQDNASTIRKHGGKLRTVRKRGLSF